MSAFKELVDQSEKKASEDSKQFGRLCDISTSKVQLNRRELTRLGGGRWGQERKTFCKRYIKLKNKSSRDFLPRWPTG